MGQCWHEKGAHKQRVEQDTERHDERDLHEEQHRDHRERGEGCGQDDTCGGDDASGDGESSGDAVVEAVVEDFFAYSGHEEDVVVNAECDEEDEREEWDGWFGSGEVEDVVEHPGGDSQGGAEGQDHGGDEDGVVRQRLGGVHRG